MIALLHGEALILGHGVVGLSLCCSEAFARRAVFRAAARRPVVQDSFRCSADSAVSLERKAPFGSQEGGHSIWGCVTRLHVALFYSHWPTRPAVLGTLRTGGSERPRDREMCRELSYSRPLPHTRDTSRPGPPLEASLGTVDKRGTSAKEPPRHLSAGHNSHLAILGNPSPTP